jgi:GR25 family glycosyltransferase involved in LPS biosynthesis
MTGALPPMFCITCPEHLERGAKAREHFAVRGLHVRFVQGFHGKTFGLRSVHGISSNHVGLLLSHYALWQAIDLLGLEEAMILEDDAVFPGDFRERYAAAYAEMPAHWQIVFVGHVGSLGKTCVKTSERTGAVYYPFGTHCYLVRRSALPVLLETNRRAELNVDLQLAKYSLPHLHHFCFLPSLVSQRTYDGEWPPSTLD